MPVLHRIFMAMLGLAAGIIAGQLFGPVSKPWLAVALVALFVMALILYLDDNPL